MTASCAVASNSAPAAATVMDNTVPPMFVLGSNHGYLEMVYWAELEEPQLNEDTEEFFEDWYREWALQNMFRLNAQQYTKLMVDQVNTRDVKYVDEVLLDPDGNKIFTGELHSRPEIPSACARYVAQGKPMLEDGELPGILLVTERYLAKHTPLQFNLLTEDNIMAMPADVVKQMEQKYGMPVERSQQCYSIGGRYTYGIIQFKGEYKNAQKKRDPDQKSALALEVFTDGNTVYSYPVEGWYDPVEGPTWNADDGGEYFASDIAAAFQGPEGLEVYYVHWAPESASTGRFIMNGGKIDRQQYGVYHSLMDEPLPVWKKDIEEMSRLYVADDPGENDNVKLTKWSHVYIDYEGEQIWISDNEEENGAFFSRENGQLKLIATVRPNLKPSFHHSQNGDHYLVLSGPAGGPSYYTEIYKMRNGKVIESFNGLEVYGELDGCSFNGKEISTEQGKAYMKALPEAQEPFIFWNDINE